MDTPTLITLPERLKNCADLWVSATSASLARLGRTVVNDSSFFKRLESPQGTTTATLEKFARFLGDPANWPSGEVPQEVRAFVHVTGINANFEDLPTGQCEAMSGETGAVA